MVSVKTNNDALVRPGHLLFAIISTDGNPTITGWPAGWNLGISQANGSACKLEIYWKIAEITDVNFSLTSSAAEQSVTKVSIIRGHDSTLNPPEFSVPTTGTSAAPNAGLLTPTGGAKDYLWWHVHGADGDDLIATPSPASFTVGGFQFESSAAGGTCTLLETIRPLNAASLDPGAGALNAVQEWVAVTIAVHPGTEGLEHSPYIDDYVTSVLSTAGTSHTVSLPASPPVGRRLIAGFSADGNPTITWPAGWDAIGGLPDTATSAQAKISVRERTADGTETATITITTNISVESSHQVFSIADHDPTIAALGTTTNGTGATVGSPGAILAIDKRNYLNLSIFAADDDDELTVYQRQPVGTSVEQTESSQTATSVMIGSHFRNWYHDAAAGTTFELSASEEWVNTFVYLPASPVASSLDLAGQGSIDFAPSLTHNTSLTLAGQGSIDFAPALIDDPDPVARLVSIEVLDEIRIKLNFSVLMKNDDNFLDSDNYQIDNNLRVIEVIAPSGVSANHVILVTNFPIIGTEYAVTVSGLMTSDGNEIDPDFDTKSYIARLTKFDAMTNHLSSMYTRDKKALISAILTAISIEDDLIGGSRSDDLD